MAEALGHTVTPLRPSLVPRESDDPDCAEMQGFSLKNVTLTLCGKDGKACYTELGEMMFTHFGVTGPLVLSASAHMRGADSSPYTVEIDLKPGLDEKKLDARILRDFDKYRNRDFANALGDLAGRAIIPVLVRRSGIAPETKVNAITRVQRQQLVALFKAFRVPITGTRPIGEAIVTSGGVAVGEVNPRTMESKLVQGLFFAGEILDVDAYTGGFNLQIAWATGWQAGLSAAESTKESKNMDEKIYSIAVDGPSGAGKSTLAKAVAARRGILYVDTGAIYRTIGCYVRRHGIDPKDAENVIGVLPEIHVDMVYSEDGLQHMLLNGEDVTTEIREPEISMYASAVSAIPEVRDFLLEMQRSLARKRSLIMDGRDIGTVVLPDADVKIYLTAAVEKRAERRMKELIERGTPRPFEEVLREMEERDWADTHRDVAPLRQAEDAILVDTSDIGFDESLELLLSVIDRKLAEG
jgi:cytidylate kinase